MKHRIKDIKDSLIAIAFMIAAGLLFWGLHLLIDLL